MADLKLSKAKLLSLMDDKLQRLNLLKAALQAESHVKQETLTEYKKKFEELFGTGKGKKGG